MNKDKIIEVRSILEFSVARGKFGQLKLAGRENVEARIAK